MEGVLPEPDKDIFIISDIDGTVQDEALPEARRIESIQPAREAFAAVEAKGVPVSLMSARTLPEVDQYRRALALTGYAIGEDGAVIHIPSCPPSPPWETLQSRSYTLCEYQGAALVLLSATTTDSIRELIEEVAIRTGMPIVSSATSTAAELQRIAQHASIAHAEASMVRFASAYALNPSPPQIDLLIEGAASRGVRCYQGPTDDGVLMLFGTTTAGTPADKGNALAAVCDIHRLRLGCTAFPRPLVLGNGRNDIPLFCAAIARGGAAIAVPARDGHWGFPLEELPEEVVLASKPCGFGVKEVLSDVIKEMCRA